MKSTEHKVDKETAAQEFDRFADAMDLDLDTAFMDEQDLAAFHKQKNRMLRAICRGDLVINEHGEAVITPSNPKSKRQEPITFHERTGASVMAMDGKKKNQEVAKTYAVMASLCEVHPGVFANLAGEDIKVCEAIFAFLMD